MHLAFHHMEKNPNYYYRHEVEFENKKNKQFYKKKTHRNSAAEVRKKLNHSPKIILLPTAEGDTDGITFSELHQL